MINYCKLLTYSNKILVIVIKIKLITSMKTNIIVFKIRLVKSTEEMST